MLRPPSLLKPPLSGKEGCSTLLGRLSCLLRRVLGGAQGPDRPPTAPRGLSRWGGRGGEGGRRGRGRVKARRSPPPEGVTAYKKGAALGYWGCRRRGRSAAAESEAIPPPGTWGRNVGAQEEGPRPWQEAARGEEAGTGAGARSRGER
jgi:hypothetical protein